MNHNDTLRLRILNNPLLSLKNFWLFEASQLVLMLLMLGLSYYLLKKALLRRFSLAGEMHSALRKRQFFPVYQPIYATQSNRFTAVEVLIRWRDDEGNIIYPGSFIQEAEHCGLIVPITRLLIRKCLIELQPWLQQDRSHHVGINISGLHLQNDKLIRFIQKSCKRYQIHPSQILLELTERDVIDSSHPEVLQRLHTLSEAGFKLAVDDFGTGHSSIQYLNDIPLSYLKIDYMYTASIGTESVTASLLEPIILLAKNLNLKIIAEGVETEEQANYYKAQGVEYLQGWHFAKAMEIDKALNVLLPSPID